MKHTICLLLVIAVFAACKKEEESIKLEKTFPGAIDFGKAEAMRAGEPWQASAFANFHSDSSHIKMLFQTFSKEGSEREAYSLNEIPLKVGKYIIKGSLSSGSYGDGFVGSGYGWLEDDGDVLGALYDHDDSVPGFLELTMVDTVAKKIAGKFDRMVFKMRVTPITSNAPNLYPQTVVFENGSFEVFITQ